ncbi:MAG: MMPL family transporter [Bacteroidales bacterium]|nr:MMPL family transporter [Bacteroidales bacterium]
MWNKVADVILKHKKVILIVIAIITAFMAFNMKNLRMKYTTALMMREQDTAYQKFLDFRKTFGEDASLIVVAFENKDFLTLEKYRKLLVLQDSLKNVVGVKSVLAYTNAITIEKDTVNMMFKARKIFDPQPQTQAELDSMFQVVKDFKFYNKMLYTDSCFVLALTCDPEIIYCKTRDVMVANIESQVQNFSQDVDVPCHISGLPYTRSRLMIMVRDELVVFAIISLIIVTIIFFLFFRSIKTTLWAVLIVFVGVIWTMSLMALIGFEMTMMSGMLAPLLIVIGVPNTIYLLNKYHVVYRKLRDRQQALHETIAQVGKATFLTNLTTAAGFATFLITGNEMLMEFGLIATMGIIMMFFLSVLMVPSVFSYVAEPTEKELKHLDTKFVNNIVEKFIYLVQYKRKLIYFSTIAIVAISIFGMSLLRNESFQVDDLPEHNSTYVDLKYFEKEMNGILPLEISINTNRKKGLSDYNVLKKIEALEDTLKYFNCLSTGTSLVDALKIVNHAYYNNHDDFYCMPTKTDFLFLKDFLQNSKNQAGGEKASMAGNLMTTMVDSTFSRARVQMRIADVGTIRMVAITDSIQNILNYYFPPEKKYECDITGTSVIFAFGSLQLIDNLVQSLLLAIFLISLCMVGLFKSWRMVFISIIPNFIPLIVTAAIMGFTGIRLKSSTILVFNIAFGISVDNAIHLFTKFKHELETTNYDTPKSVIGALRETGVSIIYSATILLIGFLIFVFSQFGGTQALGLLIDITLFVAMFTNLLFLPSMLMSFNINFGKKNKKQ